MYINDGINYINVRPLMPCKQPCVISLWLNKDVSKGIRFNWLVLQFRSALRQWPTPNLHHLCTSSLNRIMSLATQSSDCCFIIAARSILTDLTGKSYRQTQGQQMTKIQFSYFKTVSNKKKSFASKIID